MEGLSDLADGVSSCPEGFDLKRIERKAWPSQPLTLVPGIDQSGLDSFTNQGSLELCEGPEEMEHQLPSGCCAVDLFTQ